MRHVFTALLVLIGTQAAQAQVSYFGSATIGYNEFEDEFYAGEIGVAFGNYSLTVGHTSAATSLYEGVSGMDYVFYDAKSTTGILRDDRNPVLVRGDASFGTFDVAVSYEVHNGRDGLSVGMAGDLGAFSFSAGYQQDGFFVGCCGIEGTGSVYGASVGYSYNGFDFLLAYMIGNHDPYSETYEELALGVDYSYGDFDIHAYVTAYNETILPPVSQFDGFGYGTSVTYNYGMGQVRGFFYSESFDEPQRYGLDVSYLLSQDFGFYVGYHDPFGAYAGIIYTGFGNGIELGLSYAEDDIAEGLEDQQYFEGASVWLSASF